MKKQKLMDAVLLMDAYLSKLEIDNSRGSSKFCTLTSNQTENKSLKIEFSVTTRRVEIDGIELTTGQRKALLRFLKQTD